MAGYIPNPKLEGSGIIACIPQKGICPNRCDDCFFQSGRSYLEPLEENLPNIPPKELAKGKIVRINDGNDSNFQRELVEKVAQQFEHYFFNTAIPRDLEGFSGPVVLTVNPSVMTDKTFHKLEKRPKNLMYVRIRTNLWNLETVVEPAVEHYTKLEVPSVLTFMAYYTTKIPKEYRKFYEWKKRTLNSYWVLKPQYFEKVMDRFKDNPLVYSCGYKHTYSCSRCGNCLREYFNTIERLGKS